jgi:hypothetical protein
VGVPDSAVPGLSTNRILIDGNLLTGDPTRRFGGAGIQTGIEGRGVGNFDITNNGTSEVKVANNDVANGAAGTFPIRVENGSSADAAFDPTMCATISGNTTAANAQSPGGHTFPGIGPFKRSTVAANYQFGDVGRTPSPSTNANTASFVTTQNPNSNLGLNFYAGKRVSVDAGDNFVNCTHPAEF